MERTTAQRTLELTTMFGGFWESERRGSDFSQKRMVFSVNRTPTHTNRVAGVEGTKYTIHHENPFAPNFEVFNLQNILINRIGSVVDFESMFDIPAEQQMNCGWKQFRMQCAESNTCHYCYTLYNICCFRFKTRTKTFSVFVTSFHLKTPQKASKNDFNWFYEWIWD